MTIQEYEWKFFELKQYAGYSSESPLMVQHFIRGLSAHIGGEVKVLEPKTLREAVTKAILTEKKFQRKHGGQTSGGGTSDFRGK